MTTVRPRRISILGATGSIGESTLSVMRAHPDRYRIVALTAATRVADLIALARELRPEVAVIADERHFQALKDGLEGTGVAVAAGDDAVVDAARRPADWIMAAIVGVAGLKATLAAAGQPGAVVALANKESLVCAGHVLLDTVRAAGSTLLPVDSEHNAIFQVFDTANRAAVARLVLTASGGPFRQRVRDALAEVTPAEAVAHPNWSMGAKISVDSATLMNKALELIEAHYLFDMPPEKLDAVIHPQSVVHSMVEYVDGSVLAQMGTPDMRTPIAHTLGWPDRLATPGPRLDLTTAGPLEFDSVDPQRFPAIGFARAAMAAGTGAQIALNAANEIAVAAFLDRQIGFLDIEASCAAALARFETESPGSLDDILALDGEVRRWTAEKADVKGTLRAKAG